MTARITQILVRLITMGLMALFGKLGVEYDQGTVQNIALPIASGVGALAGLVLDVLIHRARAEATKRGWPS